MAHAVQEIAFSHYYEGTIHRLLEYFNIILSLHSLHSIAYDSFYLHLLYWCFFLEFVAYAEAVGRSENPGVPIKMWGHNRFPLVEIGLTDLPKAEPSAPPETTGLESDYRLREVLKYLMNPKSM